MAEEIIVHLTQNRMWLKFLIWSKLLFCSIRGEISKILHGNQVKQPLSAPLKIFPACKTINCIFYCNVFLMYKNEPHHKMQKFTAGTKICIQESCGWPVLLYGCKCWTINEIVKKLGFLCRMFRTSCAVQSSRSQHGAKIISHGP